MSAVFAYRSPTQRAELLSLLADLGEQARVMAGGTDLLIDVRNGVLQPTVVVNLKNVEGFASMSWSDTQGLIIRPGVTINDVLFDSRVRDVYPLLIACARDLASHQIRNRATVIGNVVNASPCSDMAPALLCLGARAVISSREGQREVPFTEFFTGVKRTVLRPGEILEEVIIPASAAAGRGAYCKLKRIKGHDLGIVGVAAARQNGTLRLGISSCAPTPILVADLSSSARVDDVVAAARGAVNPIDDLRCTREYREHMVEVFVRRVLKEVA